MSLIARDLFILMDSAIIANFFNSCCFPVQGHVGYYTNLTFSSNIF